MIEEKRSVMTVRVDHETHRGISIAAARSGKSTNAWVADVLEAASTASNLYALTDELKERSIVNLTTIQEFAERASQLLSHLGIHLHEQVGDTRDATSKLLEQLQSALQAQQIKAGRR